MNIIPKKVTILGSGTCVPSLKRAACASLVNIGAMRVLVDLGVGTMHRLLAVGQTIFDIDAVLLTHFHPDHSGELASFLFATRYPNLAQRVKPVTIYGGPGFTDFFKRLQAVYGHWIELPRELLAIVEIDPNRNDQYALDQFTLKAAAVNHNPESLAYRMNCGDGRSVVFSGDTDWSDNLVDVARGADLLICESATPDDHKVTGHLTPKLAGRIAQQAGVRKLVLTHFYPVCEQADLTAQCRQTYDGPIILANDLMTLDLD